MSNLLYGVLWRLDNGAECLLLKDSRTDMWTIEVRRRGDVLAAEQFADMTAAIELSSRWRATFSSELFDLL